MSQDTQKGIRDRKGSDEPLGICSQIRAFTVVQAAVAQYVKCWIVDLEVLGLSLAFSIKNGWLVVLGLTAL